MALRVAVDARIYGRRGIGRYTQALLQGLAGYPDEVVAVPMAGPRLAREQPTWVRLRFPGYILQEQLEYAVRLKSMGCDLVHLTANTAPLLRLGWPPTVVTVHDVMYLMRTDEHEMSPSMRQNLGRLYRWSAFHSGTVKVDHLIVDSAHTGAELKKRVNSLPPVTVVYPGVDDRFFQEKAADLPSRLSTVYPFPADRYFLHPGAVDPRKNTRVVLTAFEQYRARGGRRELVVVGLADSARKTLRNSAVDGVHLLPFISNEDLLMILQGARALIYVPSEEGFGYPVVEAMAAGVPAIVSSIDVLKEISAGNGLAVKPRDADDLANRLLVVDANPGLAAAVASAAKARAQAFTTRRMAADLLSVYEEALTRRRVLPRNCRGHS